MTKIKGKDITLAPSDEVLAQLREAFPTDPALSRITLPRLGMYSQDQTEGKGKAMKVIAEAGTFFLERQTDEVDEETGKNIWTKDELGTEIEGIILFKRRQLRMYDEDTELYTSSPVFDTDDEVVPLFCEKKETARGTPADLKALYQYTADDGKTKSKLEDNVILYVKLSADNKVYQLNLRGSSMYAFRTYARTTLVPAVVTRFSSEAKSKGSIEWNQMTFEVARELNGNEALDILKEVQEIKDTVASEKAQYAKPVTSTDSDFVTRQKIEASNF